MGVLRAAGTALSLGRHRPANRCSWHVVVDNAHPPVRLNILERVIARLPVGRMTDRLAFVIVRVFHDISTRRLARLPSASHAVLPDPIPPKTRLA